MEPKIIKDPSAPKGAITAKYSFCQNFNTLKKIGQPAGNIVEYKTSPETEKKFGEFRNWLKANNVDTSKLTYPAYFMESPGVIYPGTLANVDIGQNEVSISHLIH